MKPFLLSAIALFMLISVGPESASAQKVIVNNEPLSSEKISVLENYYKIKILEGRYWYDSTSGLWGIEGKPVQGIILAGLNLGGPLHPNASRGSSGVFINGREITRFELNELIKMTQTPIQQGRYWLDAKGFAGREGQHAIVNLLQVASQYYSRNNNTDFYRNSYTGMGTGSSGSTFYIIGKDFSYTQ